jgi:phage/plasmid-like protein (TIGR03299 family)
MKAVAKRPVIVSENHNVLDINWVQGLSDPGEMIKCGYLPEIRRRANEQDAEYAQRIRPIVMALPLPEREKIMGSAIGRASLDTSNGRVNVMVAGQAPWHGLGVNVKEAVTSADALHLSGTDWEVVKVQNFYKDIKNGSEKEAKGSFSVVRSDTGARLGNVGSQWKPFQNREGFAFLDKVIGEFGARYESAGSLYGGAKVFMLVHLPEQAFCVNKEDPMEPYCIFTNCHDGTESAKCFPTSMRVVCANTLRVANRGSERDGKQMIFRHTANLQGRVNDARRSLGLAVQDFDKFKDQAVALSKIRVEPLPYFDGLLDCVCDISKADMKKGIAVLLEAMALPAAERKMAEVQLTRKIKAREGMIDELWDRYEGKTNGVGGIRGTGWACFNAVTEAADHGTVLTGKYTGGDKSESASRRFDSIVNGRSDSLKQLAFDRVLEYITAS